MEQNEKWLQWAVELQAIAQSGLHYGKDQFDLERYERIREITAEMIRKMRGRRESPTARRIPVPML